MAHVERSRSPFFCPDKHLTVAELHFGQAITPGQKNAASAMTYSVFRSDAQRFGKGSFLDVGVPNGSEYNTDTAHKKTMVHESNDSPFILSNMSSKTARFGADDVGKDAAWNASYNTDTGHKKTMTTALEDTPIVYNNMRTSTKRFPGQLARNSVDETQYNTDTGHKTCMTTAVARNEIPDPATAILKSRTKRFQPPRGSEGIDGGGYHPDTKLTAMSTQTLLDSTPLQYANIRTKTDRFGKDFRDKPLDVVYDTDTAHKKCMTTAVASSPINYANMNSVVPRFKAPKREHKHNNDGGCVASSLCCLHSMCLCPHPSTAVPVLTRSVPLLGPAGTIGRTLGYWSACTSILENPAS